jgi:hypothetical protein
MSADCCCSHFPLHLDGSWLPCCIATAPRTGHTGYISLIEANIPAVSGVFGEPVMDPVLSAQVQHMQELLVPLIALDQVPNSVPSQQQRNLDLEASLSEGFKDP